MNNSRPRLLIGVTTSPRPKRYLLDTIRSAKRASEGVDIDWVIAPNFDDPGEDWTAVREEIGASGVVLGPLVNAELRSHVEHTPELNEWKNGNDIYASEWDHRGIQHNSDRLLRDLGGRGHPYFLTLQDDVIFCPHAIDRIRQVGRIVFSQPMRPAVGAISFYSPMAEVGRCKRTLWTYGGENFYGELALLWNPRCVQEFLPNSRPSNAHDLEIGRFFEEKRSFWRLYAHSPCLVQHVGTESARGCDGTGRRTSMNFREDWDAVRSAKPW